MKMDGRAALKDTQAYLDLLRIGMEIEKVGGKWIAGGYDWFQGMWGG